MAKMIPPELDRIDTSSSECRIFDLLDHDPDTQHWYVLHSLGLAHRGNKPFGEIDFVVMVPGKGIICIEVKGGRVTCEDGTWYTTTRFNKNNQLKRSPFMQARKGMFALWEVMRKHFGENTSEGQCPVGYCIIFPDISCPPLTPEFERTDVIDKHDLRFPISLSLQKVFTNQIDRLGGRRPEPEVIKNLKDFFRPDFDKVITKSTSIHRTEEELITLTGEQFARLDELEQNPRCFFEGAAGTGKTLLAIEFGRRSALKGKKVLLLCFNKILGKWLNSRTQIFEGISIVSGSYHSVLRELILSSNYADQFREAEATSDPKTFFTEIFPLYGLLAIEDSDDVYDTLAIDEAQDLVAEENLDVLDRWLAGGLAGGNWAFFGDFAHQGIYGDPEVYKKNLEKRCSHFVRAKLLQNCRNTQKIARETAYLSGFDKLPYNLTGEKGLPVEYYYWNNSFEQMEKLELAISRLLKDKVSPEEIVILGTKRLENSILKDRNLLCGKKITDLTNRSGKTLSQDAIPYCTIHAFKGMESPVIVLVDIDYVTEKEPQALLYVGMSRARSLLCVLANKKVSEAVNKRIQIMLKGMS